MVQVEYSSNILWHMGNASSGPYALNPVKLPVKRVVEKRAINFGVRRPP